MPDNELTQLLTNLAHAIREIPAGPRQDALGRRFIEVITYLDGKGLIQRGTWHVGPQS